MLLSKTAGRSRRKVERPKLRWEDGVKTGPWGEDNWRNVAMNRED
jgi:hypothetical protein